jgi:hypothetical protein
MSNVGDRRSGTRRKNHTDLGNRYKEGANKKSTSEWMQIGVDREGSQEREATD